MFFICIRRFHSVFLSAGRISCGY